MPGIYGGKQAKFGVPGSVHARLVTTCAIIYFLSVIGQFLDFKSHRILSGYLESKAQRYELQKNNGFKIQLNKYNNKRLFI